MSTQYFPYNLAPDAGTLEETKKRCAERCIVDFPRLQKRIAA